MAMRPIFDESPTDTRPQEMWPVESASPTGAPLAVYQPAPAAGAAMPELDFLARMAHGQQRDEAQMLRRARRVGEMLGARALYTFPAGGGRVEGASVHLAEALAGEYGHLWWGTRIDRMEGERVYMTSIVVDALRATVCTRPGVFVLPPAPGKFAGRADQTARWEAMQTQSAISKCQRTAILHALPDWYVEAAVEASRAKVGADVLGDRTIDQARAEALAAFVALDTSITRERLTDYQGAPPELWTLSDLVALRSLYRQLRAGELTVVGVFGVSDARDTKARVEEILHAAKERQQPRSRKAPPPADLPDADNDPRFTPPPGPVPAAREPGQEG